MIKRIRRLWEVSGTPSALEQAKADIRMLSNAPNTNDFARRLMIDLSSVRRRHYVTMFGRP